LWSSPHAYQSFGRQAAEPGLDTSSTVTLPPRLVEQFNFAPRLLHFLPLAGRVISFLVNLLLEGFRHGTDGVFMLCQGGVTMAFYIAVPPRIPVTRSHQQTAVVLPLPPTITVALSGHGHDAQAAESGDDTSTSLPLEPSEGRSRFWLRPFGCCRLERPGHDVRLECRRLSS